ncbi:hypothetical protein Tco_1274487 [Tanacetum coccineum]
MDFFEFYKELEAEFWGESATLMGLKLLQLELRLGKNPSRSFRPVKSAETLWLFLASCSLRVHLLMMVLGAITNVMSPIWSKNCTGFAIGERHLPIESIIASRSTDVMEASRSTIDFDEIQSEDAQPSENTSLHQHEVEPDTVEPQNDVIFIRRSIRIPQAPERYGFYIDAEENKLRDHREPPNYQAALSDLDQKWLESLNAEIAFHERTTKLEPLVIFLLLVDYEETFSPVANIKAIMVLKDIAAYYDYEIWENGSLQPLLKWSLKRRRLYGAT